MKKYAVPLIAVVAVALVTYGYSTQLVVALPPAVNPNTCGVIDGNGDSTTVTEIYIETDSTAGVVKIICKGVVPNPSGKTIRYNAFNVPTGYDMPYSCDDAFGNKTLDWSQIINPHGRTTKICHIKILGS